MAPGDKKPKTHQLHCTAGSAQGWGAFWGFLFGLIFFVPFLGAAIEAGMGGLTGSLADVGIDDDFIRQVREKVTPGTSALFALTSGATAPDRVIDELKAYDFEIISTNLPEEQENQLREAFAQRVVEERHRRRAVITRGPLCGEEGWAHRRGGVGRDDGVKDARKARKHRDVVHRGVHRGDAAREPGRAVVDR